MVKIRRGLGLFSMSLTMWIIVVTCITSFIGFILQNLLPFTYIKYLALTPNFFVQGYMWTLLTSMLLHGYLFHLFVNMFSLFFLGMLTEQIIGRKRMFWLYFISGIVGGIFYVGLSYLGTLVYRGEFLFGTPTLPGVGASGAIFGLLGVLSVLIPNKKVDLLIGPLIVIIVSSLLSFQLGGTIGTIFSFVTTLIVFMMIFSIFSTNVFLRKLAVPLRLPFSFAPVIAIVPLVIIGYFLPVPLPIGNTAHLGGLVAGLLYGWYLRVKYARKVVLLNRAIR